VKKMEPVKITLEYELTCLTPEEFDNWRDSVDDTKQDVCDICPVRKLCDLSMEYDSLLEKQENTSTPQLGCTGIYKLALSIANKEYGYG